jgi:hypothetical protein
MNAHDVDRAVWLEVVATVDYLSVTHRFGLTVWDALEEAIRWWTADRLDDGNAPTELPWDDPDPLRSTIERLLGAVAAVGTLDGAPLPNVLTEALSTWLVRMADRHNDGHRFAHPAPATGWPSPLVDDVSLEVE